MKFIESKSAQHKVRSVIEHMLVEFHDADEQDVISYINAVLELTRLKKIASSGYRPSFPLIRFGIYEVELSPTIGCEQAERRPAILWWVFSKNSRNAIIIPLTTQAWNNRLDFHVDILEPFNRHNNTALLDQIRAIDKARITRPLSIGGNIAQLKKNDIQRIEQELFRFLQSNN
jgi:mRNA-degrading endonuclease toxin of MazEF toxin-antitoxin module